MIFAADYDGTIAQTFVPSPDNIGVHEAYQLSCQKIFGKKIDRVYQRVGGLKNRAPIELVRAMFEKGVQEELINKAQKFHSHNFSSLEGFVHPGKGAGIEWNENDPLQTIAELLVRVKMSFFWDQIGKSFPDGRQWPEPCKGFIEFYRAFLLARQHLLSEGFPLEFAIISSGHDLFIEKCFQVWKVPLPDLLITDDLMRSPQCKLPLELRVKPYAGPFHMLCEEWKKKFSFKLDKRKALYIGDSLRTDGGMAEGVNIPFVWFNSGKQPELNLRTKTFPISDWRELLPLLSDSAVKMASKGICFSKIIQEVCGA